MSPLFVLNPGRLLVTGATGFIGHHVLAELLRRGVRCAAMLRPNLLSSTGRLTDLLADLGVDLDRHTGNGQLLLLEGQLNGTLPRAIGAGIDAVLHMAACTDFERRPNGDPWRTNVDGTRRLLTWAAARRIKRFHLVSSAYRCGVSHGVVPEAISMAAPRFHNDYEHSKWQAEVDAATWARKHRATLTVYRPSIVVGHSVTGRTTSFGGFYVMARATEVLARSYMNDDARRRATGIRLVGRPTATQNLVAVDYVASMIATAVQDPRHHGRVYHLTHPKPPTNATIKQAIDTHFDVGGSDFVDPDALDEAALSGVERLFYDASGPVRHYLTANPDFARGNTDALEGQAGVICPEYDVGRLHGLVAWAHAARWGRRVESRRDVAPVTEADDALLAAYFERYLPRYVAVSKVARMTALNATMRFVIEDVAGAAWRCRFVNGRLADSHRADGTTVPQPGEDFVNITSRKVFWEAAAGRVDPQKVFLDGQARVAGDIEAALKMAVVLHDFNREFPCSPASLAKHEADRESSDASSGCEEVAPCLTIL